MTAEIHRRERGHAFYPPAEVLAGIPPLYGTEGVALADKVICLHYRRIMFRQRAASRDRNRPSCLAVITGAVLRKNHHISNLSDRKGAPRGRFAFHQPFDRRPVAPDAPQALLVEVLRQIARHRSVVQRVVQGESQTAATAQRLYPSFNRTVAGSCGDVGLSAWLGSQGDRSIDLRRLESDRRHTIVQDAEQGVGFSRHDRGVRDGGTSLQRLSDLPKGPYDPLDLSHGRTVQTHAATARYSAAHLKGIDEPSDPHPTGNLFAEFNQEGAEPHGGFGELVQRYVASKFQGHGVDCHLPALPFTCFCRGGLLVSV